MEVAIDKMIGISPAVAALQSEVERAAWSGAKVLLTGESGVGKDIAARIIHQLSARRHMPLVTINCVGVPDSLLEPELFGHVRGSFTGAYRDRPGVLETANNGTVFLDEVCEMSARMQALLLRFMETGEIQRVGSDRVQARVDVRVLAATNHDPEQLVASKIFRADLYYRLNVIDIRIPPLRARREDIRPLLEHFLHWYADVHGITPPTVEPDVMRALVELDWPGNVRQVKNLAERLIVRGHRSVVSFADLPPELTGTVRYPLLAAARRKPSRLDAVFDRMVSHGESFWSAVYPAFMSRDLTRDDVRFIVRRGLQQTSGSYKRLVELLNMKPTDYKRFLNFLRKHKCHLPFERFRAGGLRGARQIDQESSAQLDGEPPVLVDAPPMTDALPPTGTARH